MKKATLGGGPARYATATLAGGCFWCTEALFQRIKGVNKTVSGYSGGQINNPTYEHVSGGDTGHAEAIQISFDPKKISYTDLLYIFFRTHDPTTLNRQGVDIGTQYRSVIFYHNKTQKREAERAKNEAQKLYDKQIVTEIKPFEAFYQAEEYHQNYYNSNKNKVYCKLVIDPKINKLQKNFKKYLK
jgi:peptide-methionine (S)-S-oxide reductase